MSSDEGFADESVDVIDVAAVAYYLDGWEVTDLPAREAVNLDVFLRAVRRYPSELGTLAAILVDEDFFVLARVSGEQVRLLLSDVGAAVESPLAASVLDRLGLPMPDDEDDDLQPAGDVGLLADLGVPAAVLASMCEDDDQYPDEILSNVAHRLGFGPALDEVLDSA